MARKTVKGKQKKQGITTWPLYVLFVAFLVMYIVLQGSPLSIIFGAISFFLIIILVVMEFIVSGNQEGYKKSLIELAVAVVIIAALWVSLRYLLNTGDPIDVVPSCSMLPALNRGDLVAIHGVGPGGLRVPIVNVSGARYAAMVRNISSESLVCLSYATESGGTALSQFQQDGYSLGLFRFTGSSYQELHGTQAGDLVQYSCGYQPVRFSNGTVENEAYTENISINGTAVHEDLNNSVVIYETVKPDYFYAIGDTFIVHRAYAMLNVSGSYYLLTKGDNNPGLDMQYMNMPINFTDIEGSTLFSVPYLGYFKILLSGQLLQPSGCNSTVQH
jgi:signal peptidase I